MVNYRWGDNMNVGDTIKAVRNEKGITQVELGRRLDVSGAMIAQYESGKRNPKADTLRKIAEALDVAPIRFVLASNSENIYNILKDSCYMENGDQVIDVYGLQYELANEISRRYELQIKIAQEIVTSVFDVAQGIRTLDNDIAPVVECCNKLNERGRRIAAERVEELTKIPEYKKKVTPCPDQQKTPDQSESAQTDDGKQE